MAQRPSAEDYAEVSQTDRLWAKSKEQPFVPIGFAGLVGMLLYGGYSYRNKGKMSTSIFLMHLRVKAQTMVVGAITVGIAANLIKDYYDSTQKKK